MRFSPRSLLAWIAVAIGSGDALGHDRVLATPVRDVTAPDQDPAAQNGVRLS